MIFSKFLGLQTTIQSLQIPSFAGLRVDVISFGGGIAISRTWEARVDWDPARYRMIFLVDMWKKLSSMLNATRWCPIVS